MFLIATPDHLHADTPALLLACIILCVPEARLPGIIAILGLLLLDDTVHAQGARLSDIDRGLRVLCADMAMGRVTILHTSPLICRL